MIDVMNVVINDDILVSAKRRADGLDFPDESYTFSLNAIS